MVEYITTTEDRGDVRGFADFFKVEDGCLVFFKHDPNLGPPEIAGSWRAFLAYGPDKWPMVREA